MAYTKIKPVKHHLQRCLDYTSNPKKTEKFSADDLNRLLSYTQNQNKTEHQLYVTGFRCNPATAYRRMYRTKKRWNQPMDEGDILAYHIIQSFSPGEATPDQVHMANTCPQTKEQKMQRQKARSEIANAKPKGKRQVKASQGNTSYGKMVKQDKPFVKKQNTHTEQKPTAK